MTKGLVTAMGLSKEWDVIVVGAGPAGATAARALARAGLEVLILEKGRFPRSKVCGGAVGARTLDLLDFPLEGVPLRSVSRAIMACGEDEVLIQREKPFIHMVSRRHFDALLVRKAVESGAEIREGIKVKHVEANSQRNGRVVVEAVEQGPPGCAARDSSDGGFRAEKSERRCIFTAQIVIGGDGYSSAVATSVGLARHRRWVPALERAYPLPGREGSAPDRFTDTALVDYGAVRRGYAWIFPHESSFSVGIGSLHKRQPLKPLFQRFFHRHFGMSEPWQQGLSGHPLAIATRRARFQAGPVLLVGEAAGLVDPFFGEGIYPAVLSGLVAGQVVSAALRTGGCVEEYSRMLQVYLLDELRLAGVASHVFFSAPRLWHRLLVARTDIGVDFADMVSGRLRYRDLLRNLGLPLSKGRVDVPPLGNVST